MTAQLKLKPAIILLAEDDPGDQELTKRALEECKIKNELHLVRDGEEALDYLFRRGRYEDPAASPRPD
ncbi:MAG: response regulator, partial [Thermodesulfobacteriota bacterium]|nr:response regulator [Thermodesulfobacteriota bacterium]